ncbi:MAG: rod shape-determining protein MreC [bacterium]|nr:rod shape-determining protein MreC [bacterium]
MSSWQKIVITLFTATILFFLDKAGFFSFSVNLLNRFGVAPITKSVFYIGEESSFLFKNVFGVRNLIKENIFLKSEKDFFRGEYFKILQLKEENDFLRKALSLGQKESKKIILADTLSLDPFQAGDSLLVNKGAKDGVKVGNSVILSGNILVGRVKEALAKESRIILITSAQSKVTAVSEDGGAKGVITGSASGALNLDLVLKESELRSGQVLLSSGLDGFFERGFLVGEVTKVSSSDSAPFKKALVRPFFNTKDLKQVFIVISE